jgi:hypothetical protein
MRTLELVHTVKVRVRPEVEPEPASGKLVVRAGAPANLRCRVVRGSPAPELTWRRQSRPLPGGEEELTAEALTFPATTRHHSGLYTCAADNGWGAPAEAVVRLDVQHKPEIEQEETFIHTRDGDEVEITCTVHASPAAEVEWYRNGVLLHADRTVIQKLGNRHSLLLQNVGQQDRHGKYQCRARNALGEAMALTEVSGNAAPANFKSPAVGRQLTAYTLEWVVTSTSPVTEFLVEWRPAGGQEWATLAAPIAKVGPESFSGMVSLEGLGHGAAYEARVAATNAYGLSSPSKVFQVTSLDIKLFPHIELTIAFSVLHIARAQVGPLDLLLPQAPPEPRLPPPRPARPPPALLRHRQITSSRLNSCCCHHEIQPGRNQYVTCGACT